MTFNEIDAGKLKEWKDSDKEFHLLDVRSQAEMEQAMIPGGKPLPVPQIDEELSKISQHEELVIYCRSGIRSAQVCSYLVQKGFRNVYNLRGGIIDWYNRGNALSSLLGNHYAEQTA